MAHYLAEVIFVQVKWKMQEIVSRSTAAKKEVPESVWLKTSRLLFSLLSAQEAELLIGAVGQPAASSGDSYVLTHILMLAARTLCHRVAHCHSYYGKTAKICLGHELDL